MNVEYALFPRNIILYYIHYNLILNLGGDVFHLTRE